MKQTIDIITKEEVDKLVKCRKGAILVGSCNTYLITNQKLYKKKGNTYYELKIKKRVYWNKTK